jgi:transposase
MLQIPPQVRVLVAVEAVDFRCGMDGLSRRVREGMTDDPFSGAVFVFRNRAATAIKLLVYDGQGFWLCHKRLSSGRFRHWPDGEKTPTPLLAQELQVLLHAGDPEAAGIPAPWKALY